MKQNADRVIVSIIALVILTTGIAGLLGITSVKDEPIIPESFYVMTYNIHQSISGLNEAPEITLPRIAAAIRAGGKVPSIIGLQEVDVGRINSGGTDALLYLSQELGMRYIFAPAIANSYGVGILSIFPILQSGSLLLPSELGEQRALVWVQVKIGDEKLTFTSLHFGLEPEERSQQITAVLNLLPDLPQPIILAGDFNANPNETTSLEQLVYPESEAFYLVEAPDDATMRIDHLIGIGEITTLKSGAIASTASDEPHELVWAEISL